MEQPKPVKQTYTAYDYNACRDYLQAHEGYEERDYSRKYPDHGLDTWWPYWDFWLFGTDKEPSLGNHAFFTMTEAWKEGAEPWQRLVSEIR